MHHTNWYAIHHLVQKSFRQVRCMHHTNWYAIHPPSQQSLVSYRCMHHTNWYAIHHVYCNYLHNKLLGYLPSGKNSLSLKRYSPLELFFCAHSQFDCSTMFQCRVSLVLIDHYEAGIEPATHYHNLHQRAESNGINPLSHIYIQYYIGIGLYCSMP